VNYGCNLQLQLLPAQFKPGRNSFPGLMLNGLRGCFPQRTWDTPDSFDDAALAGSQQTTVAASLQYRYLRTTQY
jgi:hypothetical protein